MEYIFWPSISGHVSEDLASGRNFRLDGIGDPFRTRKFVVNMEYITSNPILMSPEAIVADQQPVRESTSFSR
jgi:hypothetical protein